METVKPCLKSSQPDLLLLPQARGRQGEEEGKRRRDREDGI